MARLKEIAKINQRSLSSNHHFRTIAYLDTGSITENKIHKIQYLDLACDKLPSRARRCVQENSILFSTVRPNQNHFGILDTKKNDNFVVSTGFCVIDVDTEKANPRYVYYFLTQPKLIATLQGLAEQSVSTYPTLKPTDLEEIEIVLPSLTTQDQIVSVLKALDKKISNNLQINDYLMLLLRELYRAWFIDFRPFGGKRPSNWKNGLLKDILDLKKDGIQQGERKDLPYLPIDAMPMRSFAITELRPNSEAKSSLILFKPKDILVGAMRVYFHRVLPAPIDGITRSTCFVLSPRKEIYFPYGLLVCDTDACIDFANSRSKGSTMPYAVWEGGMGEFIIDIPTEDILSKFGEITRPFIEQLQHSLF